LKNNNIYAYLENLLEQYKNIVDISAIVSKADTNGNITYVNEKFCNISGYSRNELLGKNHNIVRHSDVPSSIYVDMWKTIKSKKPWKGRLKNRSKDGKTYYVDTLINPLLDEKGEITEFISLRYDITNITNHKQQLIDDIKDAKKPLLMVLQFENYIELKKIYNRDILHGIKNEFVKKIFHHLPKSLIFDKVYRLSNGRFAFLKDLNLNELKKNEIKNQLKKFYKSLHLDDLNVGDNKYDIQAVLAYATRNDNIYENIMSSLYKIQEKHRNFVCSDDEFKQKEKEYLHNINIIELIKNALNNNQIKSYYQPIVCNRTNSIIKYESLVRIEFNDKIIPPNEFLEIAKKGRYYHHITTCVLENTFSILKKIDKQISVNISSFDIENIKFRRKMLGLLKINQNIASRLTLEILEDENIIHLEDVKLFIDEVKNYGVKIAIDDFGVGYSNFSRLMIFKPDYIKIDGSLISNIENDKYSLNLVKTIQSFCKSQNIKTIAEFVSNENIFNIIKEIGIDFSQGFYFGKPEKLNF
jgi:PAS domain S-box-containing protein